MARRTTRPMQRASTGHTRLTWFEVENFKSIKKITGAAGIVGSVMPLGGMLTPEQQAPVRDWIAAGAPND